MKNGQAMITPVKAVIFDYDGVFHKYSFLGPKTFYDLCLEMAARAIGVLSPLDLPDKARKAIAVESYREFNSQTEYAKRALNICQRTLHRLYHEHLFDGLVDRHPEVFEHSKILTSSFNEMAAMLDHVAILSHASSEAFIRPYLEKLDILKCFNTVNGDEYKDTVFGQEEYGFYLKDRDYEPFEFIEKELGIDDPSSIVMVEDTATNLFIPKERGWKTVWLSEAGHNREDTEDLSMVDAIFSSLDEFTSTFIKEKEAMFTGAYKPMPYRPN